MAASNVIAKDLDPLFWEIKVKMVFIIKSKMGGGNPLNNWNSGVKKSYMERNGKNKL
jgi:hypothetical protein